jgi:hypothetical protein
LGTLILCLNHFEILIIPYMLRYYSMGRADDMDYIGEYLEITTSGHFSSWDIYPAIHIIGASLSMISSLEAHYTSFIIPIVFSFIFIAGIYLFSRKLFPDSCINLLVLVSSFILYLGVYNFLNVPHAMFFSFIPLYLWLFSKYAGRYYDTSFAIIFVLVTLLIPITHPFVVFFLFLFFLSHMITRFLTGSNVKFLNIQKIKISSFSLLVISFIDWLINNSTLMGSLGRQYKNFINKVTEPVFFETTQKLAKTNFGFLDYLRLFSLYYGRYALPTFIIIISGIYLYFNKNLLKEKVLKNYPYLLFFYIVLLLVQIVLLFNPLISHQPDRIMNLNFVIYGQIPLFSCSLYVLFLKKSTSFNRLLPVCIILSIIWSLSLFGCFDSPNVYRANVALANNEICGMDWFYKVKDESTIIAPISNINRFHGLFGNHEKQDILKGIPDHFGYVNNSDTFVDVNSGLDENSYIIILTLDELLYQEVPSYKAVGRYTKEDFSKFRSDTSVNEIYDSKNIEIFRT